MFNVYIARLSFCRNSISGAGAQICCHICVIECATLHTLCCVCLLLCIKYICHKVDNSTKNYLYMFSMYMSNEENKFTILYKNESLAPNSVRSTCCRHSDVLFYIYAVFTYTLWNQFKLYVNHRVILYSTVQKCLHCFYF